MPETVERESTTSEPASSTEEVTQPPVAVVTVTSVEPPVAAAPTSSVAAVACQARQSPSGNIRCVTGGSELVTCVILSIEFAGPAGCQAGPVAVSLPRGAGDRIVACAGATPAEARALAYEETVTEPELSCVSTERGMNCTNTVSGTAFLVAKSGVVDPNAALTLTPQGLGPLRMGMTIDEVLAVEPGFVLSDDYGTQCRSGNVSYAHLLFNPDGGLALISTENQPVVRTADGLALGDPASRIADSVPGPHADPRRRRRQLGRGDPRRVGRSGVLDLDHPLRRSVRGRRSVLAGLRRPIHLVEPVSCA